MFPFRSLDCALADTEGPQLSCRNDIYTTTYSRKNYRRVKFRYPKVISDNREESPRVMCRPHSGSKFYLGRTKVYCAAWDCAGNKGVSSFYVTVRGMATTPYRLSVSFVSRLVSVVCADKEDPRLHKSDITVTTDAGKCSAVVDYTLPKVYDNSKEKLKAHCYPKPGSEFSLGDNIVRCHATDSSGNKGTHQFTITVTDSEPPVITCPSDLDLESDNGTVVAFPTFSPTASDNCYQHSSCSPSSASEFQEGVTQVRRCPRHFLSLLSRTLMCRCIIMTCGHTHWPGYVHVDR